MSLNTGNIVGGVNPDYSANALSMNLKTTTDMGLLKPIYFRECQPGDVWKIGCEVVARFMPLITPILHEFDVFVHYFYVRYANLWKDWTKYITKGKDGKYIGQIPKWPVTTDDLQLDSIWESLGLPIVGWSIPSNPNARNIPHDLWRRAYTYIWDEYYRDENLQNPINADSDGYASQPPDQWNASAKRLQYRNWKKDYFTASLPFRQKGDVLSLPIAGTSQALFSGPTGANVANTSLNFRGDLQQITTADGFSANNYRDIWLAQNKVDLSVASTFDIADFRQIFALQRWMERNARCGTRYHSFLLAHFKKSPTDLTLQRPDYIGGYRSPMVIHEITQTSESTSDSPQGEMVGHGLSAGGTFIDTYRCLDYGVIMGILSVMPKPAYEDGIPRELLRNDAEDFLMPEFTRLSEQAMYNAEVYPTGDENIDMDIFAYTPVYDELRTATDRVTGLMRVKTGDPLKPSLGYWHYGRSFDSLPSLNSAFITCDTTAQKNRCFAIPSQPAVHVNVNTTIEAYRPIPEDGVPGLIDHI